MNSFSKKLHYLRIKNNLTYLGLSKLLQVSPSTIFRWEHFNCNIKARYLYKLSMLFKVSVDYLIGFDLS